MKNITKTKGFTLIELLVVIAIIGILAGIVLVNVRQARQRAEDAAIKGNLATLAAAAEMYYDDNGFSYDNFFSSDDAKRVVNEVELLARKEGGSPVKYIKDDDNGWVAAAGLNASDKVWCTDYLGTAKEIDEILTSGTECP